MASSSVALREPNPSIQGQSKAQNIAIRRQVDGRLLGLRTNRYSWWVHWRELADYYLPRRYKWLITPNMILQPVFKVQKVTTAVKIYDGATVVLGGAKIQKHTLVEDKVPILGDLPFVGRMFKSTTKQTDTKNIIIFVTVDVIDPSGRKINRETAAVTQ